jgi:hypothetical protein
MAPKLLMVIGAQYHRAAIRHVDRTPNRGDGVDRGTAGGDRKQATQVDGRAAGNGRGFAISVPALLMAVAIDLPPTRSCLLPELIVVTIAVPPEPTCCRPWLLIVVTLASRLTD